jgi:O-methyltransferase involved in polyketide biosynthesis
MLISATSALVLNWTSSEIWKSRNARDYINSLDLSEGSELYNTFDGLENYMLTQAITNRKYFVRKHTIGFLQECEHENTKGQVIILAAGIAPLSVEIASFFPENTVFDVDKYSMPEKGKHLHNTCPNIKFIECDIINVNLLQEKLTQYGWDTENPTIVVIEGIIYYLMETDLRNLLSFFAGKNARMVADFVLKPEYVNVKNRIFGVEVFGKISDWVGLEFLNFYEPEYFMALVRECGFKNPKRFTMDEIQKERTGQKDPFDFEEPAWVSMVKN